MTNSTWNTVINFLAYEINWIYCAFLWCLFLGFASVTVVYRNLDKEEIFITIK